MFNFATVSAPAAFDEASATRTGFVSGGPLQQMSRASEAPAATASARLGVIATVPVGDQNTFVTLCEAFLAQNDPYLEAAALSDLAEEHGWNERSTGRLLERFGRLGWLRPVRSAPGRAGFGGCDRSGEEGLALVEITFAGLDAYCRIADRVNYPALVREVAGCLVAENRRPDTGPRLRSALLTAGAAHACAAPDLLLAHAVEALGEMGLVESCHQWASPLGFQIGRVAPELRRWIELSDAPAMQLPMAA